MLQLKSPIILGVDGRRRMVRSATAVSRAVAIAMASTMAIAAPRSAARKYSWKYARKRPQAEASDGQHGHANGGSAS